MVSDTSVSTAKVSTVMLSHIALSTMMVSMLSVSLLPAVSDAVGKHEKAMAEIKIIENMFFIK
jgi:hypothetical protein